MTMASLVLGLIASPAQADRKRKKNLAAVAKGKPAPMFRLRDLTGRWVSLSSLLRPRPGTSKKPAKLLLTFFTMECKPCKKEHRLIKKLWKKKPGLNLVMAVIALPKNRADVASIEAYFEKLGVEGTVLLDQFQLVAKKYGVKGSRGLILPANFVIDPKGQIQRMWTGFDKKKLQEIFK